MNGKNYVGVQNPDGSLNITPASEINVVLAQSSKASEKKDFSLLAGVCWAVILLLIAAFVLSGGGFFAR